MIHSFKHPLISMPLTALHRRSWMKNLALFRAGNPMWKAPQCRALRVEVINLLMPDSISPASMLAKWVDGHSFGHLSRHLLLILSCAEGTRSRPHAELDTHKRPSSHWLTKNKHTHKQARVLLWAWMHAHTHTHTHKSCLWSLRRTAVAQGLMGLQFTALA